MTQQEKICVMLVIVLITVLIGVLLLKYLNKASKDCDKEREEIEAVKQRHAHLFTMVDMDFEQYRVWKELENKQIEAIKKKYNRYQGID